jgi:hypothetical protein
LKSVSRYARLFFGPQGGGRLLSPDNNAVGREIYRTDVTVFNWFDYKFASAANETAAAVKPAIMPRRTH